MSATDRQVGYNALISRYGLICVEDRTSSFIAKRRSVVDRTERADHGGARDKRQQRGRERASARRCARAEGRQTFGFSTISV